MISHRAVIEVGPSAVRRICCGTVPSDDTELTITALEAMEDPFALVDGEPVAVPELWGVVLRSLACPNVSSTAESLLVVVPSWWSSSRVDTVAAAARTVAEHVVTRTRSELLSAGAPADSSCVVVEIAARLVAITATRTVAEPRIGSPRQVADRVLHHVRALALDADAVRIDGPVEVDGAPALAAVIRERLHAADVGVTVHGEAQLARLARSSNAALPAESVRRSPPSTAGRRGRRLAALPVVVALLVAAAVVGLVISMTMQGSRRGPRSASVAEVVATTFLVEGRVTLQVPAHWQVQRVTSGPGSPRVQVISPTDPQVMLLVTQSQVPDGSLTATAESLRRALQREHDQADAGGSADVFVDFNASGNRAGRDAVTYREIRAAHHVDWTVLLDGAVRISIGCQSRPDAAATVREVCERAIGSAHALG